MNETNTPQAIFPAAFTVHWPTGPVPCCVRHAQALIGIGRAMRVHIVATGPTEGAQCINCVNEAKRKGGAS